MIGDFFPEVSVHHCLKLKIMTTTDAICRNSVSSTDYPLSNGHENDEVVDCTNITEKINEKDKTFPILKCYLLVKRSIMESTSSTEFSV